MILRTLSSKLFRQEVIRKLWLFIAVLVCGIIVVPLGILIRIDAYTSHGYFYTYSELYDIVKSSVINAVCIENVGAALALGIVTSFLCFSYLYSKSKIDLYHSMPLTRGKMFVAEFVSGYVPVALALIIETLILGACVTGKGFMSGEIAMIIVRGTVYSLVALLLSMSVAVVAIMLTGNIFIGICGSLFFMFLTSAVKGIISYYFSFCFETYAGSYSETPIALSIFTPVEMLRMEYMGNQRRLICVAGCLIVAVVVFFVGKKLYEIRPSESVGKSLIYAPLKRIARVIVVAIASLYGGIYMSSAAGNASTSWYWIAFVGVGLIAHIIVSTVFEFDFKASFKHLIECAVTIAVTAVIANMLIYDCFGYDTYIPDSSRVASTSVCLESVEYENEIYAYNQETGELDNCIDKVKHIFDNVQFTDTTDTYALANAGVAGLSKVQSALVRNSNMYTEDDGYYVNRSYYVVCYTLNSGRKIYRRYSAPIEESFAAMNNVYSTDEYKESLYTFDVPYEQGLLTQITVSNGTNIDIGKLQGDMLGNLVAVYKQDLMKRTLNTYVDNFPIASLAAYSNLTGYDYMYGYYIYKEDTATIAYLKSIGIDVMKNNSHIDADRIVSIEVYDYDIDYSVASEGNANVIYHRGEDDAIIKQINEVCVPECYTYNNSILHETETSISAYITYIDEYGPNTTYSATFRKGEMPAKVRSDLDMLAVG